MFRHTFVLRGGAACNRGRNWLDDVGSLPASDPLWLPGAPAGQRSAIHRPVRPAHQPLQRKDLPLRLVCNSVSLPLLLLIISVHQVQGLRNGRSSFRPSARLSRRSTAATVAGGFAAERRRLQQISIDSWGAVLQAPALISKCGQHHVGSRWTRLNTDLY